MSQLHEFVKKLEQRLAVSPERKPEPEPLEAALKGQALPEPEPLETALKGRAVELWSTAAGHLFLVSDEADARQAMERLGARRGEIYTAAEVHRIIAVNDPSVVAEIHEWKRTFDARLRECRERKDGA